MSVFREESTGKTVSNCLSWLWALLFGFLVFMYHGCYGHAFILFLIDCAAFVDNTTHTNVVDQTNADDLANFWKFVHFIYALCAPGIIGRAYIGRGWIKVQ